MLWFIEKASQLLDTVFIYSYIVWPTNEKRTTREILFSSF